VPAAATIWAPPQQDYKLAMMCDCFILATGPAHSSRGLPDMRQRRIDAERLIDPDVPDALRRKLLAYYGIERFYVHKKTILRRIRKAYGSAAIRVHRSGGARVVELRD
jgi:hypothetical protein